MPVDDYYQGYSSPRRRNQREPSRRDDKLLDDLLSDEPVGRLAPARPVARVRARRRRRSVLRPFLLFLALLAAGVLALPYAIDVYYADRVLPGVRVQGVNVQGVSREALRAALATRYADF